MRAVVAGEHVPGRIHEQQRREEARGARPARLDDGGTRAREQERQHEPRQLALTLWREQLEGIRAQEQEPRTEVFRVARQHLPRDLGYRGTGLPQPRHEGAPGDRGVGGMAPRER